MKKLILFYSLLFLSSLLYAEESILDESPHCPGGAGCPRKTLNQETTVLNTRNAREASKCPPLPTLPKDLAKIEILKDDEFGYWVEVSMPKQYKTMHFYSLVLIGGSPEKPSFYVPVKMEEGENEEEYWGEFGAENKLKQLSMKYLYSETQERFCSGKFIAEQSFKISLPK